jgi:hypothetical protein
MRIRLDHYCCFQVPLDLQILVTFFCLTNRLDSQWIIYFLHFLLRISPFPSMMVIREFWVLQNKNVKMQFSKMLTMSLDFLKIFLSLSSPFGLLQFLLSFLVLFFFSVQLFSLFTCLRCFLANFYLFCILLLLFMIFFRLYPATMTDS